MDKLLELQLRHLPKFISVDVLHVKDRWLTLLATKEIAIDQVIIEIKVEGVPKVILDPQVFAFLLIKILGTLLPEPLHIMTIIHGQVWRVASSGIGSVLRLLGGRSRA